MPPFTLPSSTFETEISDPRSGLTGSIPSEIGTFTHLTSIDLGVNNITSSLPSQLGLLTRLTLFNLEQNKFTGRLPTQLGRLTNTEMTGFGLASNHFNGTIPSQLGQMNPIDVFDLSRNSFWGLIPSQLGLMANSIGRGDTDDDGSYNFDASFELANNRLTGPIPSELGMLTGLYLSCEYTANSECFTLHDNERLCGNIPSQLKGMSDAMTKYVDGLWLLYVKTGNGDLGFSCDGGNSLSPLPTMQPTTSPVVSPTGPTPLSNKQVKKDIGAALVFGLVGGVAGLLLVLLLLVKGKRMLQSLRSWWRTKGPGRGSGGAEGENLELNWIQSAVKRKWRNSAVAFDEGQVYSQEDIPSFTSAADGKWTQDEIRASTAKRFSISRYSGSGNDNQSRGEEPLAPVAAAPKLQANASALVIPVELLNLGKKPFAAGASGSLFRGHYNGTPVAAKMLYSHTGDKEREEFDREFRMLAMLRHPNIVALYGMSHDRLTDHLYLVQEYIGGGDLHQLIRSNDYSKFTHGLMSSVLTELLGAVRYMHASGIAHRDLKPMNLLITEHNSLRVCDLGLARNYQQSQITANVGTALYMPPEAFDDSSTNADAYDASCWDVFSLGVIVYELWHRGHPWMELGTMKIFGKLMREDRPPFEVSGANASLPPPPTLPTAPPPPPEGRGEEVVSPQNPDSSNDGESSSAQPSSSSSSSLPLYSTSASPLFSSPPPAAAAPPLPSSFGAPIPPPLQAFIEACWAQEASERLPIKAVLETFLADVKPHLLELETVRVALSTNTSSDPSLSVSSEPTSYSTSSAPIFSSNSLGPSTLGAGQVESGGVEVPGSVRSPSMPQPPSEVQ